MVGEEPSRLSFEGRLAGVIGKQRHRVSLGGHEARLAFPFMAADLAVNATRKVNKQGFRAAERFNARGLQGTL